jgi:hypothetical protein
MADIPNSQLQGVSASLTRIRGTYGYIPEHVNSLVPILILRKEAGLGPTSLVTRFNKSVKDCGQQTGENGSRKNVKVLVAGCLFFCLFFTFLQHTFVQSH